MFGTLRTYCSNSIFLKSTYSLSIYFCLSLYRFAKDDEGKQLVWSLFGVCGPVWLNVASVNVHNKIKNNEDFFLQIKFLHTKIDVKCYCPPVLAKSSTGIDQICYRYFEIIYWFIFAGFLFLFLFCPGNFFENSSYMYKIR